jgi:antitoxin component of RelBE/YafQ-DinJ toxin-antitoxin module
MPKARKRGRPALPKKHVKANIVPMRLKDEDLKAFTKAAKSNNLTLSEWMRLTLREAIQTEGNL